MDFLAINETVGEDDSIARIEMHDHFPLTSAEPQLNDEVRFLIQNQDLISLPCNGVLVVSGKFYKLNADNAQVVPTSCTPVFNFAMHLFSEITYAMDGVEIERIPHPGIVTTIKHYMCRSFAEQNVAKNAGFTDAPGDCLIYNKTTGHFHVNIPLKFIFGYFEDHRKITMNVKQELVLRRAATDRNAFINTTQGSTEEAKVQIERLIWRLPHVQVSDPYQIELYDFVRSGRDAEIAFRVWTLYINPSLAKTKQHVWPLKICVQVETPRYGVLGLQTDRLNKLNKNASKFDHCQFKNGELYLNSLKTPYGKLNIDFASGRFGELYGMLANFQESYYGRNAQTILSPEQFSTDCPIVVIDCSKQNESVKTATIDARIEFETQENIPDNTTAFMILIHDCKFKYNPLSGRVTKII